MGAAQTYTLTAHDADQNRAASDAATQTITITVNPRPDTGVPTFGTETIDNQTYTVGTDIGTLTLPTATGDGAITYALTPALPDGLMWNEGTSPQTITGEPTTATAAVDFTYTAADTDSNDDDTAVLTFTITVNPRPDTGVPTFGTATIENQTYTVGTAITTLELPTATGDGAITYALTPALPDGLMWNEGTSPQTITGEPTTATAAVDFTYTAADTDSNADPGSARRSDLERRHQPADHHRRANHRHGSGGLHLHRSGHGQQR